MRKIIYPTPEEDEAINRGIAEDPDTFEVTDFSNMVIGNPFTPENMKKLGIKGRPRAETTKEQIAIRLDPDVIAHFKKGGRGWQTRINNTLREVAGLK